MEIKSLSQTDFGTIFEAFSNAFADYEVQLTSDQLRAMLKRRGFNADLSFAAFDRNRIVAFTLNGTGEYRGIPTAYDTGTGTLEEYRGRGLASDIFEYSLGYLKQAGIKQYLLEVLQHNAKAVSVYRKLGFAVTREFNCFMQKNDLIDTEVKQYDARYCMRPIRIEDFKYVSDFWDFYPSWQNDLGSIKRSASNFVCLGVFKENRIVGYCVFEPASGDIAQLAVDVSHRRQGIGSLLLARIIELNKWDTAKSINSDLSCVSMTDFMNAKNIGITAKQFEMILKL